MGAKVEPGSASSRRIKALTIPRGFPPLELSPFFYPSMSVSPPLACCSSSFGIASLSLSCLTSPALPSPSRSRSCSLFICSCLSPSSMDHRLSREKWSQQPRAFLLPRLHFTYPISPAGVTPLLAFLSGQTPWTIGCPAVCHGAKSGNHVNRFPNIAVSYMPREIARLPLFFVPHYQVSCNN